MTETTTQTAFVNQELTSVYVTVDRAAAIRRGINGTATPVLVDLDVSTMSQADRDDIAARLALEPRCNSVPLPGPRLRTLHVCGGYSETPLTVVEPTQAGVLAALAAHRRAVADHAAEQERRTAEAARLRAEMQSAIDALLPADCEVDWIGEGYGYAGECRIRHTETGLCTRNCSAEQLADELDALRQAVNERAARHEAQAAAEALAAAEQLKWVTEHGSAHLRALLDYGLPYEETLEREQRLHADAEFSAALAAERPGWCELEVEPDEVESDPTPAQVEVLRQALIITAAARLGVYEDQVIAHEEYRGRWIGYPLT